MQRILCLIGAKRQVISVFLKALTLLGFSSSVFAATSPLAVRVSGAETYVESMTFTGTLQGNSGHDYFLLQLSASSIGPGDGHAACRAMLLREGHSPWTAAAKIDEGDWAFRSSPHPTLDLGQCKIESLPNGQTKVFIGVEGSSLVLVVKAELNKIAPPFHRYSDGDDAYDFSLVLPPSDASLTYTLKGQKPQSTRVRVYADKLRATLNSSKVSEHWYRLRKFDGEDWLIALGWREPGKKGQMRGWVWQHGNSPKQASFTIAADGTGKWAVDGCSYSVKAGKRLYHYEPIKEYGFLGKLAKPFIGNPTTNTHKAQAEALCAGENGAEQKRLISPSILEISKSN